MNPEKRGWRPDVNRRKKPSRRHHDYYFRYHWIDNQEYREQEARVRFINDTERKYRLGEPRLANHFERRGGHDFENFFVYLAEKWFPELIVRLANLKDDKDHTDIIMAFENLDDVESSFCLAIDMTINQDPNKLVEKIIRIRGHHKKQINNLPPEIVKRDCIPILLGIDSHNAGQLMHKLYMAYDGANDPRPELSLDPQFQDLYIEVLEEIIRELQSAVLNNQKERERQSVFYKNIKTAGSYFQQRIDRAREERKRRGRNPRLTEMGNSYVIKMIKKYG